MYALNYNAAININDPEAYVSTWINLKTEIKTIQYVCNISFHKKKWLKSHIHEQQFSGY